MNSLKSLLALAALALTAASASASTVVIDFKGLAGNNANTTPFTTYKEGGYTVAVTAGSFLVNAHNYGDPVPSIYTNTSSVSTVTVTDAGALFNFDSVDLGNFGSNRNVGYTVTGLNGSAQIFTVSGILPQTDIFQLVDPNDSTKNITSLKISLTDPSQNGVNIDNITLSTPASVTPEPSSLILLGSGLIGVAGTFRSRIRR